MKSSLATLSLPPDADLTNAAPARKHRILYIASTRHSGGLEVASVRLAELLMRSQPERQEIIFACRPGSFIEEQCIRGGIPTVPLIVRNSGDLSGVKHLARMVTEHGIDIMHVHSRRDYVTSTLAKVHIRNSNATASPKLLLHMHLMRSLGSPALLSGFFFAPYVDRFLAVSDAVRDHLLLKHPQLRSDQVVVVPNSVSFERFGILRELGPTVRNRYSIPQTAFVVGMVGRLDTKGQNEAIKAFKYLNRRDVYLMLVGAPGKPSYLKTLETLARRMGVGDRVVFCGRQEDIPAYFSAMDLFLHLPRDEAFGLAPAEAMSAGLPVVLSGVGGCLELVEEGRTGLVVPPRRPEKIAQRLQELIASPGLRERLATAGKKFVRSKYTTEAQVLTLTHVYNEVMMSSSMLS